MIALSPGDGLHANVSNGVRKRAPRSERTATENILRVYALVSTHEDVEMNV